ncbi:MAG: hypothetical protein LBF16_01435 [Pseudomonadales bacterium]|nr:hypothetical protein [Pseudomonadales bacterium]
MSYLTKVPLPKSLLGKEFLGAVLIAAAWLAVEGFQFDISNNIFHIPFVLRWYELPQFENDAFYQTLPSFTSALWWLLRLFATEEALRNEFLAIHILGRIGGMLSLLIALRTLAPNFGLRMAVVTMALASPLMRESPVGAHGVFFYYLSHSSFLWPFFIGALACAERGRWRWAAALGALTFSFNAFMGFWCASVLAAAAWINPQRPSLKTQLQAAVIFVIVALPMLVWIVQASLSAPHADAFSFREYIRDYYPFHFLIEAARFANVLNLAAIVLLALLVCRQFGWRFWALALLTLAGIFVVGAVLPYLFDNRTIFNLHFLRVDGALMVIAIPLLTLTGLQQLLQGDDRNQQARACALLLGCIAGQLLPVLIAWSAIHWLRSTQAKLIFCTLAALALITAYTLQAPWLIENGLLQGTSVLCIVAVALSSQSTAANDKQITLCVALLLLTLLTARNLLAPMAVETLPGPLLGLAYLSFVRHRELLQKILNMAHIAPSERTLRRFAIGSMATLLVAMHAAVMWLLPRPAMPRTAEDHDWIETTAWFRAQALPGPVLVPLNFAGVTIDHNFQLHARTPVWVDWKQGAAVMWSPAFYWIWHPRYNAVQQLQTPEQFADYARANGITTFVVQTQAGSDSCALGTTQRWRNASFAVCVADGPIGNAGEK